MKSKTKKNWKFSLVLILTILNYAGLAQSGSWNGWNEWANGMSVSDGSGGYFDHGGGVIQLTNDVFSGCTASAVHSGTRYNHCDSNFSKCYQVLFGCGDADGLAFTFSYGCNPADWKVWGCGGGLGYRHGCAWNQGVTIEFDTYNNAGGDGFDGSYAGAGANDEIAIHRNVEATDGGKLTAVSVPDLEDGLEHLVCITYDRMTHVVSVSIDGVNRITYDLDNGGLNPSTYFSGCELLTTWSAGTNAGLNMQAVSDGARIIDHAGKLCPQMLPVEFLNVNAHNNSSGVEIFWSTASEQNNQKFLIERSIDSKVWETIGEAPGAGNSGSILYYGFTDHQPLTGISYYRVKQVDFDGRSSYSKIVSVGLDNTFTRINPNPFTESFTINSNFPGGVDIKIQDEVGRVVFFQSVNFQNGEVGVKPELSPGVYLLTLQSDSFVEQKKIIRR